MRLLKDRRGQARVIEAFLASMLLLSCLTLIPAQSNFQNVSAGNDNLESMAENALLSLNSDGQLSKLIDSRDWTNLSACIEAALPLMVWFNLTVYNADGEALNTYPICNGGAVSNKIASVEYVCVSPSSTFAVYVLQLQLAKVD
ncbi:MAG: hypothetical protein NWE96_03260 [Candidatus Bathyarchaeota archaeon]|nr:hypothetical protein [Candidatus Bathyarchaeota archaeon]